MKNKISIDSELTRYRYRLKATLNRDERKKIEIIYTRWLYWLLESQYITTDKYLTSLKELLNFGKEQSIIETAYDSTNYSKYTYFISGVSIISFLLIFISFYLIYTYIGRNSLDPDNGKDSMLTERSTQKNIAFEGKLINTKGVVITEKIDLTLRLYRGLNYKDSFLKISCIGADGIMPNYNGIFTFVLGRDCNSQVIFPLLKKESDVFLEFWINEKERLNPRIKLNNF